MAMLEKLIKSIFEDAKQVDAIRRQHAYVVDLCRRGEQAQDHIHLKLRDSLIPEYEKTKAASVSPP